MASNRIARINEEIQRQISADIRRLKDPRVSGSGMVSVTRVDTTGDLRYAKIYVSVLDKSQEKDVLKGLKSAGGFLRRELGSALGAPLHPGAHLRGRRLHRLWRPHPGGHARRGEGRRPAAHRPSRER